jgi:hypothetical protein
MAKEAVIQFFLLLSGTVFKLFNLLPLQDKTVMLASFGDNIEYVIGEVKNQTSSEIFILKEPRCKKQFEAVSQKNITDFTPAVSFPL